jgi:hypothetical protein
MDLSDYEVDVFRYWLRFAPAVCLVWTLTGIAFASPVILASLVPFALLGAVLRGHPFDLVYDRVIRPMIATPRLPCYGMPRRFACLMAASTIGSAAAAFATGFDLIGYAIGLTMIVMAAIQVFTGYCIPSAIYGLFFEPIACDSHTLRQNEPDRMV